MRLTTLQLDGNAPVTARRAIADCPAAREDDSVPARAVGYVQDVDTCAEPPVLFVEFEGRAAIACSPEELA